MAAVLTPDLLVIGAGAGGLSVAAGAAQMGARVLLLEGGRMGGDCLNHGCVPSKALLAAARHGLPFAGAMDQVAQAIAAIAPHDSQERFEGLGVQVIRAFGRFTSAREVEAGGQVIRARRVVIATGSTPLVPPIPGLAEVPYLTSDTLFDLRDCPDHLLIAGAGPVGVEMAQAHVRLGARVTLIDAGRALGREDPDLAVPVLDRLRAEGVEIVENAALSRVEAAGGAIRLWLDDGKRIEGSHLLLALGRRADLARLNLEAAGIAVTGAGIRTDARLRTTNRRVFAVGDAAGQGQFTHLAGYHAGIVLRSALFSLPARTRADHIPRVTYTDPELAQIGLTEPEARARFGPRLKVFRADYAGNDRAVTEVRTDGFAKLMVVGGRPVGVSIVGEAAGELIGPWALVMANRLKLTAIAGTVLPYPTLGELNKRLAGAYFSDRLFDSQAVKRMVRVVQRVLP